MIPAKIQEYIDFVRSGERPMCREQFQLVDLVEKAFLTEDIRLDEEQANRYLGLQKHFPYRLLLWEEFCFLLQNCVYKADGQLRWPKQAIVVGRGAGKNGYLGFVDFCLLTPVNGIKNYDIEIYAKSEDQAKRTFDDIWDIFESNPEYWKRYFDWTKEEIKNKKTNSRLTYKTSKPDTKDSSRPGKVDFDEFHAYENNKLVNTAVTGLGKKPHPRRTVISTMGDVRDGPMDKLMERAEKVLSGSLKDNGWLYFICRLDSDDEINNPDMWGKANPSLYDENRPELLNEIRDEFQEYLEDPAGNHAFATKRMNRPKGDILTSVTSWENIQAASAPFSEEALFGCHAVGAIDYASTQDFVSAGVLIPKDGFFYWLQHTWVCAQSRTLNYVKFPLQEAELRGELTMVDDVEIGKDIPVAWLKEQRERYNLILSGIDHFRYSLLSTAFKEHGFNTDKKEGNLKLTYDREQSMVAPIIASAFINHKIIWGDCMIMRWFTNNATRMIDKRGNITFGKIEPKSRKTDGFMALVMAFICYMIKQDVFETCTEETGLPDVYVY